MKEGDILIIWFISSEFALINFHLGDEHNDLRSFISIDIRDELFFELITFKNTLVLWTIPTPSSNIFADLLLEFIYAFIKFAKQQSYIQILITLPL